VKQERCLFGRGRSAATGLGNGQDQGFWNEFSCNDVMSRRTDRLVLGCVGQGSAWRLCKIRWHAWGRAGGKSQAG
jgi:hypothetical protein